MPRPPDLHDTLAEVDEIARAERRAVLATLVATQGTTPKKSGATMWVGEGGRILGSVTIGGCVDAQVIAAADAVLASDQPKLLTLSLRDEEGWDLGLTCGGTLRVLVEPVALEAHSGSIATTYGAVRQAVLRGQRVVLVSRLPGTAGGASKRGAAARFLVDEAGSSSGTLGDPALDAAAAAEARLVLDRGESTCAALAVGGMTVEAFFALYAPPPRLLVFGATHVAMPLVAYASVLGWRTTVIDARERFATRARFPDADAVLVGSVGALAKEQRYDGSTFVVIVTHDYKFERPILQAVLTQEPAYIGLLAGRRRARALREFLVSDGLEASVFDRIHMPIGLPIGAQTPAEIALGILAEIVAV